MKSKTEARGLAVMGRRSGEISGETRGVLLAAAAARVMVGGGSTSLQAVARRGMQTGGGMEPIGTPLGPRGGGVESTQGSSKAVLCWGQAG